MKIRASVTSVADSGESLSVAAQGVEVAVREGETITPLHFRVRNIAVNRHTFRIGRELVITIEAK